jgi:hypothetical protein
MISNQSPSPYGQDAGQPRPVIHEDTLKAMEVQIERKLFVFTLKGESSREAFAHHRRNSRKA